jgi:hypothetical protein
VACSLELDVPWQPPGYPTGGRPDRQRQFFSSVVAAALGLTT